MIVIAGYDVIGALEFVQDAFRSFGLFQKAPIGDIPGYKHEFWLWVKLINMINTQIKVLRHWRDTVCFFTPPGDVGITNMRN